MKLKRIFTALLAAAVMATTTAMSASALDVTAERGSSGSMGSILRGDGFYEDYLFQKLAGGAPWAVSAGYDDNILTEVVLPDTVNGENIAMFIGVKGITNITIPEGITIICEGAFIDSPDLTDIYYKGTEEQWNNIKLITNETIDWYIGDDPDSGNSPMHNVGWQDDFAATPIKEIDPSVLGLKEWPAIHFNSDGPDSAPSTPDNDNSNSDTQTSDTTSSDTTSSENTSSDTSTSGSASSETSTSSNGSNTDNPETGVAGIALMFGSVLAGAAVVVSRKRK